MRAGRGCRDHRRSIRRQRAAGAHGRDRREHEPLPPPSSRHLEPAVRAEHRLRDDAVRDAPHRERRGADAGGGRADAGVPVRERRGQTRLARIAEGKARSRRPRSNPSRVFPARRGVARREPVRVIAEALGVHALELHGEIRRAAVVGGIEPIGLTAGRRADLYDLDVHAAQTVDDRLARGAGAAARQDVDARQVQRRQRLSRGAAEKPTAVERNGIGVSAAPVTGLIEGYLPLKCCSSNVWPAVAAGPAIM